MRMQYSVLALVAGILFSVSAAAQSIMSDDFSTGDVSKSVNGFTWAGGDSSNDPSSATYVGETVTRDGEVRDALQFEYKAGSRWAEKGVDLGKHDPARPGR